MAPFPTSQKTQYMTKHLQKWSVRWTLGSPETNHRKFNIILLSLGQGLNDAPDLAMTPARSTMVKTEERKEVIGLIKSVSSQSDSFEV